VALEMMENAVLLLLAAALMAYLIITLLWPEKF
jgi:K+-transporting ATPase KdpF subunit